MNADDEGGGFKRNHNEKSSLLHPAKKRRLSSGGKKLPSKCVKRRRFSSRLSLDKGTEIEPEPDISSYAPAKLCRTSTLPPASSPSSLLNGRERKLKPGNKRKCTDATCGSLSRTAVIYEQQRWEGEILQERDIKQERGRPRKQYLVRWKESWVDGARLTAPELLRDWREKRAL